MLTLTFQKGNSLGTIQSVTPPWSVNSNISCELLCDQQGSEQKSPVENSHQPGTRGLWKSVTDHSGATQNFSTQFFMSFLASAFSRVASSTVVYPKIQIT